MVIKEFDCLPEGFGKGFKRLYPSKFSRIIECKSRRVKSPASVDEALVNRRLTKLIGEYESGVRGEFISIDTKKDGIS